MQPRNYLLQQRNFKPETIIQWQLGFCPAWQVYTPRATQSGKYSIAEKAGIIKTSNGRGYDFYHHRITIPIHNTQGKLVGFGGRIVPGFKDEQGNSIDGPKYLNPPDSSIYDKSKILFGLSRARKGIRAHGCAVLVEGYFDVIRLHETGWNNAVATCGTALTEQQAKEIKRYTDTVVIMRDGDAAGLRAIEKDIPILVDQQLTVQVLLLPQGQDPDTLFGNVYHARNFLFDLIANGPMDGIEYLANIYLRNSTSPAETASAIDKIVSILSKINSLTRREQYIKSICKAEGLKVAEITRPLDKLFKDREKQNATDTQSDDPHDKLPAWVNRDELYLDGFAQLRNNTKGYNIGIYVFDDRLYSVTNFTIAPLYHIYEQSNNRRLLEVYNGEKTSVVEMPSNGFVTQSVFEIELVNKGNYRTYPQFKKNHFKLITGWLMNKMPIAYELKTLGWQPEGFFAYSNSVYHNGQLINYDDLGMIKVDDTHFISMANSRIRNDERITENPYENDLYLKYTKSKIDFATWARLFHVSYADNAPVGIAFVFLTMFKDIVTRSAKMPMLYCFGPKGSGKSQMAESVTHLFFSGKNSDGDLIKGYNLNPGQGTPFSFFNRVERFRNCPILFNEFDENNIEDWKFGTMKAAYDGEGREVGAGDTGKKRKTVIQKVLGTIIIVGQYLSTKDDGSVLSRSLTCQFSLERLSNLTTEQVEANRQLKEYESAGLSSILTELMKHRAYVENNFAKTFAEVQQRMMSETREAGERVEQRLISNYSLIVSATKIISDLGIALPYTFEAFYNACKIKVMNHNRMLKDNNALHQFWKTVEVLFDNGFIQSGRDIKVARQKEITLYNEGRWDKFEFETTREVLFIRFDNVYAFYAKHYRERTGNSALGAETLLLYLKEQPYYYGLTKQEQFSDKRTSAYAFNYKALEDFGVVLQKNQDQMPELMPVEHNRTDQPF